MSYVETEVARASHLTIPDDAGECKSASTSPSIAVDESMGCRTFMDSAFSATSAINDQASRKLRNLKSLDSIALSLFDVPPQGTQLSPCPFFFSILHGFAAVNNACNRSADGGIAAPALPICTQLRLSTRIGEQCIEVTSINWES